MKNTVKVNLAKLPTESVTVTNHTGERTLTARKTEPNGTRVHYSITGTQDGEPRNDIRIDLETNAEFIAAVNEAYGTEQ